MDEHANLNGIAGGALVCGLVLGCTSSTPPVDSPDTAPGLQSAEPAQATSHDTAEGAPSETPATGANAPDDIERLEVAIRAKSGSAVLGKAELTDLGDGVKVVVRVARAQAGLHAVHIHEFADCSAEDASSAGPHFNPEGHPHGLPNEERRHLGDLGNLVATAPDGTGRLQITVPGATLRPDAPNSFVNRALVIHADDDEGTQPSGNAGDRIACAELTLEAAQRQALGEVVAE